MLGNTVDSSSFAMGTSVGHSVLKSAHSLDVYNMTFLLGSYVCGQKPLYFPEGLREHIAGASLLPLCVSHFGELLEHGGSG